MQRIDDLEGKAELTVREPAKREGSYEPSSQGRLIRNLYSGLIIWSGRTNNDARNQANIMMIQTGTPG